MGFRSVDGEADRPVHLLPDESGSSGVGLERGAGQDPVSGQHLLFGHRSGLLGFLQLPDEDAEEKGYKFELESNRKWGGFVFI